MSSTSPQAFLSSAALHAGIAGMIFLLGYVWSTPAPDDVKVFELVQGEGDNYMAREAPALGTPGGVSVEIAQPPAPTPTPVAPAPAPEVTPVAPAPPPPRPRPTPTPVTPAPAPKKEPVVTDFKKQLVRDIIRGESKAKMQIKKEQDAEKKKLAAEKKKQADEERRMTKEEFDKKNKTKTVASASSAKTPAVTKIDVDGIAKGVVGGSSKNKVGGAGGKALVNDNDDVLAGYDAIFKQRLRERFESPPGLSDSLKVTVTVRSAADGTLSGAKVVKTSGSNEFDQAVLEAIRRVRMPERPDKKADTFTFVFNMTERSEG